MVSDINELFENIVDTPKEGVERYNKQESLEDTISERKVNLLGAIKQWINESPDKATTKSPRRMSRLKDIKMIEMFTRDVGESW